MKNTEFDRLIQKGLQEQAASFAPSADTAQELRTIFSRLPEKKMEEINMTKTRQFHMKKFGIAAAAAVMLLGTVAAASGKITTIVSSTLSFPDYTKYADLSKAEAQASVITDAPERFSNGYKFHGIYVSDNSYRTAERSEVDSFTSLEIEYRSGSDKVLYAVQPRPILADDHYTDTFVENGITYYYREMRNKWVPVGYEPTAEEQAQMDAGTLNIGIGASEISYSDSKRVFWEVGGHQRELFCMDNDISKNDLLQMAFEIE